MEGIWKWVGKPSHNNDYLEEGWDQDAIYISYRSVQRHGLSLEN